MILYKSDKLQDVAFQVLTSKIEEKNKVITLKVAWWNTGKVHAPYPIGVGQTITLPIDKWDSEFYSINTKDWVKQESNEIPYNAENLIYEK